MATRKEEINLPAGQELSSIQITINFTQEKPISPIVGDVMRQVIINGVYYSYFPDDESIPERTRITDDNNESEQELWYSFFGKRVNVNSGVIILRVNRNGSGTVSLLSNDPAIGIVHNSFYSSPPGWAAFWQCLKDNGGLTAKNVEKCTEKLFQ